MASYSADLANCDVTNTVYIRTQRSFGKFYDNSLSMLFHNQQARSCRTQKIKTPTTMTQLEAL